MRKNNPHHRNLIRSCLLYAVFLITITHGYGQATDTPFFVEAEDLVDPTQENPQVFDNANASGGKLLGYNFASTYVDLPSVQATGDGRYILKIGHKTDKITTKSVLINGVRTPVTLPDSKGQFAAYQVLLQLTPGELNTLQIKTQYGDDDQGGDYDYFELGLASKVAPFNAQVNDAANTFGWDYAADYPDLAAYEYSLDRGKTWADAPANPVEVGDELYAVGQVQVRVKAEATDSGKPGFVLSSDKAYSITTANPPTIVLGAPLWRLGNDNQSAAEFSDYGTSAEVSLQVPADWNSRSDWSSVPRGLKLDQNGTLVINYTLGEVPANGVEFRFRLLDAHRIIPQLNVFSNEVLTGLIQLVGLQGSEVDLKYKDTYQLYIPKEFLQPGENQLRLSLDRGLFADESADNLHRFVWDYLSLVTLAEPANEPIHGRYVHIGNDFRNLDDFNINARNAFLLSKWSGIAYSGNWMRIPLGIRERELTDGRRSYLETLRELNINTMPNLFTMNYLNREAITGTVTAEGVQQVETYLENYGDLLTALEVSNEPGLFKSAQVANLAATQLLVDKRPTFAPHLKIVAPGWAYWPTNGTPDGWARDPAQRREIENLVDVTNGHSYNLSGTLKLGGSLIETLRTYSDYSGDGFPKPMAMSETGSNDRSTDDGRFGTSENRFAALFDREIRGTIGYVDYIMYHADYAPEGFQLFDYPGDIGSFNPMDALAHPNQNEPQNPRLKTYRRLALAYATHGAPLTYEYVNREELAGKRAYFRAVNTATLGKSPIGAASDKTLVNFTNFDTEPLTMQVRVVMPKGTQYVGDRFGAGDAYSSAHSRVQLSPEGDNSLMLTETLGPGESAQYILSEGESSSPSVPTALVANAKDFKQVNLRWEASSDNRAVAGYNIYRDGKLRNVVPASVTFFADQSLTKNTVYTYEVAAFDDAGNESARSTAASATTDGIPVTPGGPKYEAEDCIPIGAEFPKVRDEPEASGGKVVWNVFFTSRSKIYGVVPEQEDYVITIHYKSDTASVREFLINEELPIERSSAKVRLPVTDGEFRSVSNRSSWCPVKRIS